MLFLCACIVDVSTSVEFVSLQIVIILWSGDILSTFGHLTHDDRWDSAFSNENTVIKYASNFNKIK